MPALTLLAGPNGAGKTSFSQHFLNVGLITTSPVNIDALEMFIDPNRLPHDALRFQNVRNREVDRIFTGLCEVAVASANDFSYECNLRIDQLKNVRLFDDAGYSLRLFYFWLDDVSVSIDRVRDRAKKNGNIVGERTIKENFRIGLENLDKSFQDWGQLMIFDNTCPMEADIQIEALPVLLYMCNGKIEYVAPQFYAKKDIEKSCPG